MGNCKPFDITETCLAWYAKEHGYSSYIDAQETAKLLNVSRPRITQLVSDGIFHAVVIGFALYIPFEEIQSYNSAKHWEEITNYEGC